jgi:hypothetical protein
VSGHCVKSGAPALLWVSTNERRSRHDGRCRPESQSWRYGLLGIKSDVVRRTDRAVMASDTFIGGPLEVVVDLEGVEYDICGNVARGVIDGVEEILVIPSLATQRIEVGG